MNSDMAPGGVDPPAAPPFPFVLAADHRRCNVLITNASCSLPRLANIPPSLSPSVLPLVLARNPCISEPDITKRDESARVEPSSNLSSGPMANSPASASFLLLTGTEEARHCGCGLARLCIRKSRYDNSCSFSRKISSCLGSRAQDECTAATRTWQQRKLSVDS